MPRCDFENYETEAKELFSLLSKEGTFTILNETDPKLVSRRNTPRELGLTKRQYYSRLRDLKDMELIEKVGEGYVKTEKGERVLESAEEITLLFEGEAGKGQGISTSCSDGKNMKVVTDYDELAEKTGELFKTAEEEVILASRYLDYRVISSVLEIPEEVDMRVISTKFDKLSSLQMLKALTSFEKLKKFYKLAFQNSKVTNRLPFSFLVQDRELAFLEIPNQVKPDSFFFAILVEDAEISEQLIDLFNNLYDIADEEPVEEDFSDALLDQESGEDFSSQSMLKKILG